MQGAQQRFRYVVDIRHVHEGSSLADNRYESPFIGAQQTGEDRVISRSEDSSRTQGNNGEPLGKCLVDFLLGQPLRPCIRIDAAGRQRLFFPDIQPVFVIKIDRWRGDMDKPLHPMIQTPLYDVSRSDYVRPVKFIVRSPRSRESPAMKDGRMAFERAGHFLGRQIHAHKSRARRFQFTADLRTPSYCRYLEVFAQQTPDQIASQKSRRACHKDFHIPHSIPYHMSSFL